MPLNDIQYQELRQMARQCVGRVSERAHFVLMRDQGMTQQAIARTMDYSLRTVQRASASCDAHGAQGLHDAPRSGRPPCDRHLTDIVETQASQPPTVYGYLQTVWTVALLALHLAVRFRIVISPSTVRRALRAISFSWPRPKLTPVHKPDPQRATKLARLDEVLACDPAQAHIVAVDACDVHLLAVLRSMWQRIGTQARLPTPGANRRRGIFGALNVRTGQWHYLLTARKRSVEFIQFLEQLTQTYHSGLIYVIADNCIIHASAALRAWLTCQQRIQLIYLPTYSGHELNPVEKVWWLLKQHIAANRNYHSLPDLDAAIHRCCLEFTPHRLLSLANCSVIRHARLALSPPYVNSFG